MSLKKKVLSLPNMSPMAAAIAVAIGAPTASLQAATITVDTTESGVTVDSYTSLEEAFATADGTAEADTIVFAAGVSGTISLSYDLDATTNITIDGGDEITIELNDDESAINVDEGGALTLSNMDLSVEGTDFDAIDIDGGSLTLSNVDFNVGNNNNVRAIHAYNGAATLTGTTISNVNDTGGLENGGAVALYTSTLTATDTVFEQTDAESGGAIFAKDSTVNLSNTNIENSESRFGAIFSYDSDVTLAGSVIANGEAEDGGVAITAYVTEDGAGSITLNNSDIRQNNTSNADGTIIQVVNNNTFSLSIGSGSTITNNESANGVITIEGNGEYNSEGTQEYDVSNTVSITGATFSNNESEEFGSILDVETTYGTQSVTIADSIFSDHASNTTTEGFGNISVRAVAANTTVSVSNSRFNDNNAGEGEGGAIGIVQRSGDMQLANYIYSTVDVTIDGSEFNGNESAESGGALSIYSARATTNLTITESVFEDNYAEIGGGAIDIHQYGNAATTTITDSIFDNNFLDEDGSGENAGGALRIESAGADSTLTIANTSFSGNSSASVAGGAIAIDHDSSEVNQEILVALLDTEAADPYYYIDSETTLSVTISDSLFENNESGLESGAYGGAIDVNADTAATTISVTGSTFDDNESFGGGALSLYQVNGLANVTIGTSTFSNNMAESDDEGQGGALRFRSTGDGENVFADVYNELSQDTANDLSGQINVTISDSTFDENDAYFSGAIFAYSDSRGGGIALTITNGTFTNNVAGTEDGTSDHDAQGGAVFLQGENGSTVSLNVSDSVFNDNRAGYGGAIAIYADGGAGLYVAEGTPANLTNSSLTVARSTFDNNEFFYGGGAIAMQLSGDYSIHTATITDSTFSNNEGGEGTQGGAVFFEMGAADEGNATGTANLNITSSTFAYNSAADAAAISINFWGGQSAVNLESVTAAKNESNSEGDDVAAIEVDGSGDPTAPSSSVSFNNTVVANSFVYFDDDYEDMSVYEERDQNDLHVKQIQNASITISNSLIETPIGIAAKAAVAAGTNVLTDMSPGLGVLKDNGGTTLTMKPIAGSPLLEAGQAAADVALATDQTGAARVQGSNVDMGAVEGVYVAPVAPTPEPGPEKKDGGAFGNFGFGYLMALAGLLGIRRKIK